MKEATGELNMTVVTIVAVAALLAFFYLVIWPNLESGMALSSGFVVLQMAKVIALKAEMELMHGQLLVQIIHVLIKKGIKLLQEHVQINNSYERSNRRIKCNNYSSVGRWSLNGLFLLYFVANN